MSFSTKALIALSATAVGVVVAYNVMSKRQAEQARARRKAAKRNRQQKAA